MPRRITVECSEGHRDEITIGINDKIPNCSSVVVIPPDFEEHCGEPFEEYCGEPREVVWVPTTGLSSPGFRVKGMTKNFRR